MTQRKEIEADDLSYAHIPTYIVGPFIIDGEHATREYNVPFTVTEKPIIPSVNRGRKIVNLCGGAHTIILKDEMTRAPLLIASDNSTAEDVERYIKEYGEEIERTANSTTNYGRFTSIDTRLLGSDIYMRVGMSCGDAAGHNMTTQAASAIADHLVRQFDGRLEVGTLSSNYCIDKKPALINIEKGRGKTVEAHAIIPEETIEQHLRTTGKRLQEINYKKNIKGSELAGSLARNAQHANIVAAIYLATGQDIANVVEGSLGETAVESVAGETLFLVRLPSIIVGTVGGGTTLPYAQKNLELLGCCGTGTPVGSNSKRLAEIIAAAVLAGEISLMGALANNSELLKTHLLYER